MLVGVCDFPSRYAFPPKGYGGIERWLWAAAVGARQVGADVHLLGHQWRRELADDWVVHALRLEDLDPASGEVRRLRDTNYDILIVGHEYPSLAAWRTTRDAIGCEVATFQHWPYFRHQAAAFDGASVRLYCYSDEMCERYSEHHPSQLLAVHLGWQETEQLAGEDGDLLWLGRIDKQKAPHIAIKAAQVLDRRITIAGPEATST
jgi:glycosyltransferase involved in cell wall biosynthesis